MKVACVQMKWKFSLINKYTNYIEENEYYLTTQNEK
jgi:hypothetical protein